MNRAFLAAAAVGLLVSGCVSTSPPEYSLTGNEAGIFHTNNGGRPIAVSQIKGMDERQLAATFGPAKLDRKDASTRMLRYTSDGCTLLVYMSGPRANYVEAYDPQLRPLINVDACAGSVAAQRGTV
jgi:hypothetical protein